jgi:hypothetical protein
MIGLAILLIPAPARKVIKLRMMNLITSMLENMNALEPLHLDHFRGQSGKWPRHVTFATDHLIQLCIDTTVEGVVILIAMYTLAIVIDCLT